MTAPAVVFGGDEVAVFLEAAVLELHRRTP